MDIRTHRRIDQELCGTPLEVEGGVSRVRLQTSKKMAVDDSGLVHGGFIFGLADYSAMIAVNHPNVVLGAAEVRFLKPVKADQALLAEAKVDSEHGKKRVVSVTVRSGDAEVFEGRFVCFVLDQHVLSKGEP
ncbi:MAG: thioesterase [Deltaproteobacteria bacterium]|nr:thioesterase [Deltaproteobacteria bacterium]MBW2121168.1 thioesterase [Deltaproteobacteria bacterium]